MIESPHINRYRPGPGWAKIGAGQVYDHASGLRIHVSGMCRLPNGVVIVGCNWPRRQILDWFVRVNGGARRRGVMAWALAIQRLYDFTNGKAFD